MISEHISWSRSFLLLQNGRYFPPKRNSTSTKVKMRPWKTSETKRCRCGKALCSRKGAWTLFFSSLFIVVVVVVVVVVAVATSTASIPAMQELEAWIATKNSGKSETLLLAVRCYYSRECVFSLRITFCWIQDFFNFPPRLWLFLKSCFTLTCMHQSKGCLEGRSIYFGG